MCDQKVHRQFEEMLTGHFAQYHNHKETMAHAASVIQLGLFAWIMTKATPVWVKDISIAKDISISKEWVVFLGYLIIWLVMFLYTCWQLRNRRIAAEVVRAGITRIGNQIHYVPPEGGPITERLRALASEAEDIWLLIGEGLIYGGHIIMLLLVLLKTYLLYSALWGVFS